MYYLNGEKYVGDWKDNNIHGASNFLFLNGNKYESQW